MSYFRAAGAASLIGAAVACAQRKVPDAVVMLSTTDASDAHAAPGDPELDAQGAADGSFDAALRAGPRYRSVLHVGDSMVGFRGGLSRALENRFEDAGVRFYSSASTSAGIRSFASSDHLEKLLSKLQPDAVILTLGTNNMTVPYPEALKGSIASIAKRIAPRDCYWIGPPSWKPDAAPAQDAGAALVLVLEEATLPCKFFDSSKLQLERQSDGVHPTNLGGEKWADAFWLFWLAH